MARWNMAFWRERLLEISGFDPIYRAAGDDVGLCWKLVGRGYNKPGPSLRPGLAPMQGPRESLLVAAARLRQGRSPGRA